MRKYIGLGIVLAAALGVALFFGGKSQESSLVDRSDKIHVVTSIPLLKYLVETVGGEEVLVTSVIKGANCSHEYEPSTGDMREIAQGAIAVKAGMDFDAWFDKLVESSMAERTVIDASKGVAVLHDDEEHEPHDQAEEIRHPDHGMGNPHYWGDPENVRIMARNIMEGLIKLRPNKKGVFLGNYQAFDRKLTEKAAALRGKIAALKENRVVSYSAAFPYFFAYFGIDSRITVESTCEQEVSPKRILEAAELINKEKIRVVIGEKVYPDLPEGLAKETGARVVLLWPSTVDSGDYLQTMEKNVESLVLALK